MRLYHRAVALLLCCFASSVNLATAREYNAAIYIDQATGITGTAYNFSTIEEAKAGALQTCKKKSGKKTCIAAQLWSDGCGAVAWSPKNKSARGRIADTSIREAEQKALARCQEAENDPNCKIVSSICTDWEKTPETYFYWW